jgi:murein DD-endopeptidase MepM/ murein hydrolase activator NlpD
MPARRYTIVVADRTSGVVRRLTISARPVAAVVCAAVALPALIGVGAAWKARSDVAALFTNYQALELENENYRTATAALSGQIESLQTAIRDVGADATLDPNLARSMEKLPPFVKSRAMGGGTVGGPAATRSRQDATATFSALANPEDTFGLLRSLLEGLETRLHVVRRDVDKRNALAEATPSLWPAHGWLTSSMGYRRDPMTGASDYHGGLDIAGEKGQPVYATASGTVESASYKSDYGNLIVIDHGFGLQSRYGHLSKFGVRQGQQVKRGDVIGNVGATGKATGYHLHYEVLANGKLLNPLQLLTQQRPRDR